MVLGGERGGALLCCADDGEVENARALRINISDSDIVARKRGMAALLSTAAVQGLWVVDVSTTHINLRRFALVLKATKLIFSVDGRNGL